MEKEIGSFIEFDIRKGRELYGEEKYGMGNVCRVNSGRAAIVHAIKCYGVKKVYLPIYECDTVRREITTNSIEILYYKLDDDFMPQINYQEKDSAIVVANYFGIFGSRHFRKITSKFNNIIIDNAQAFYAKPISGCFSCYSPRKFVGVPDGGYVVGENATYGMEELELDYSSDTVEYLFQRLEYGCSGKAYKNKVKNDERIDIAGRKQMSVLTRLLLGSFDYQGYAEIRKKNFVMARNLFDSINEISIDKFVESDCIPYVYPLLIRKDGIIENFHKNHVYQGHWWEYLVGMTEENTLENILSRYIVPITIDQRYNGDDIKRQYDLVKEVCKS